MSDPVIGATGMAFLESRKIRVQTASRFGIYTARSLEKGKVAPDAKGKVLAFPYVEGDDAVVAEKYRDLTQKKFWQRPGGRKTFWNSEVIDLASQNKQYAGTLFVFEGEIDALTAIDCGFECSVSVPDGAPQKLGDGELDPKQEASGKFAYLWNNRERLKSIKEFVLAVDNDEAGMALAAELVRRLSASRCSHVEYPDGCKDISDVRQKHGVEAVKAVLVNRKPYPVTGLYRLSDYPDLPTLKTFQTGWSVLDSKLRLFPGEFMVVTGIPGHGKSTWVLNLCLQVAKLHGWKTAMFSPEMPVTPLLRDKLRSMHAGCQMWDAKQRNLADDWIEDTFVFIDSDPGGGLEAEEKTLEWLIEKGHEAVMRDDVRMFVIDPFNEVEHARRAGENQTEYIGRAIRMLRQFAQDRGVVVIVVAHPTKDIAKEGKRRAPVLYDIDGSAHWANKPDHGVTIHRGKEMTVLNIEKVRFAPISGKCGKVNLNYLPSSERYVDFARGQEPVPQSHEPQDDDEM
jgi:twinkle protein